MYNLLSKIDLNYCQMLSSAKQIYNAHFQHITNVF
jgi:hypothetical protein